MQFDILSGPAPVSDRLSTKLTDLVCCGSDQIQKNLIYGVELPLASISTYLARTLSTYLDRSDPMGLDWSILAVVLGLQDMLPRLEELRAVSRTACVLNEWIGLRQDQARIMDFLLKVCNVCK